MSIRPKALVLEAPGINCDRETASALDQAGAQAKRLHISELGPGQLSNYEIFVLSGGFSYGDAIRSGAVLGLELNTGLTDDLNQFVQDGKPVIGICNGFQALIESGLLTTGKIDDAQPKTASLIHNESGKFECRWVPLQIGASVCRYLKPEQFGEVVELPVAHGEGRFVAPQAPIPTDQKVFSYSTRLGGKPNYPDNPNGSRDDIAGICDPSGVVLGMMPHPERFISRTQHPNWRRGEGARPFGAVLFKTIVNYAKEM